MTAQALAQEPIHIGSRLELFVEDTLIERLADGARLQLHQPVRREIVFKTDAPWEGNACGYPSVFQDGQTIRLYYHGLHYRHSGPPAQARAKTTRRSCASPRATTGSTSAGPSWACASSTARGPTTSS